MKFLERTFWLLFVGLMAMVFTFGCSQPEPEKPCPDCKPKWEKEVPKNYSWKPYGADQAELVLDGQRIGVYDYSVKTFTEWKNGKWGRMGLEPPVACPIKVGQLPTGLDATKLSTKGEHFQIAGEEVSRENALEYFQGGPCPNCPKGPKLDPNPGERKARVTVVSGNERAREDIRDRWCGDARFAAHRDSVDFWACEPGHWSVEDFPATEQIIFQSGDGAVLHRQENLNLDNLSEALRKKNPHYDPRRDVDAGRGLAWWMMGGSDALFGGALLGIVAVMVLVLLLAAFLKG